MGITTAFCDMTPYSVEVTDISKEHADTALLWQDVDTRLHGVRNQILKTLILAAVKKNTSNVGRNRASLSKMFNTAVTVRSILLYTSSLKMIYRAVDGVRFRASPFENFGGQSRTGTGYSPTTSVFPCQYHSTIATYSLIHSSFPHRQNTIRSIINRPIPVAARSKARVCGRSLAGTVGSNPIGGMDACLLRLLCVVR